MSAEKNSRKPRVNWRARLLIMISVVFLHFIGYYLANLLNSMSSPSAFRVFHTVVDSWIPYIDWTWVFYYWGDIYILLWPALIFWRFPTQRFRRGIYAYIGMIILGASIQIIIPGKAPWPEKMTDVQQLLHNMFAPRPYAVLPSMHVSLAVLPTLIGLSSLKSNELKIFSIVSASLITISTLTLKEHHFLDALAGLVLGIIFYSYWRKDIKNN